MHNMLILICWKGSNSNSLHVPGYWTQLRPWAATPVFSCIIRWYRNNNNIEMSVKYSSSLMACKALVFFWWTQTIQQTNRITVAHHFHMCYPSRTSVDWLMTQLLCFLSFHSAGEEDCFRFMVLLRLLELLTAGGRSHGRLRSTDHFRP
jgi:hypothetical protein